MPLLSKTEVQFLEGQKQVSKSYIYKLKSIIKKKIAILIDQELPLLDSLFPNLDLTKFSKNQNKDKRSDDLTNNIKISSPTLSHNHNYNKELDCKTPDTIDNH